ncbi:MAG: DUF4340 domain-containing protein [Nitrospirales bacterium]
MLNNPIRITLLLALIVLGLGSYILFVDIPQTRQFQKQETQERQLLPFDDRDITTITWATATEIIHLERDDKWRWTITKPMRFPADNQEVRRILRALTIGKIKRIIEDGPATLDKYGLDPPYLTLTLNTPTTTQELALGDRGPFAPSLYVQTKADDQVVLTTLDVMTFAQKTLTNFRLKDLLFFDRERVQEVHLQQADTTLVMARTAGVHSLSPNWMFTSPMKAPADKITVGTLLMDLSGLTATGFVDSEEEKQRILGQPSRTHVGITILEGPRTHHVSLYQFQDAEKAYALTSSKGPLYEISPSILNPITQGVFYFQDKRLFGMEINDVVMLEVTTPQQSYGLIKQHAEWIIENEPTVPLNQEVVNLFVSRVVDIPAEISHPEHSPSALHHGLDSPSAIIRGRNRQGQEIGQLVLGKREKGLVFARGAGHQGLYQVRDTILDQIPNQAKLVRAGN